MPGTYRVTLAVKVEDKTYSILVSTQGDGINIDLAKNFNRLEVLGRPIEATIKAKPRGNSWSVAITRLGTYGTTGKDAENIRAALVEVLVEVFATALAEQIPPGGVFYKTARLAWLNEKLGEQLLYKRNAAKAYQKHNRAYDRIKDEIASLEEASK